jgi:hypothetical protein
MEAKAAIEAMSALTDDAGIGDQYFGARETEDALADLSAEVAQYLLSIIFDLKIERRFILDRDRSPLEIAITEYGKGGWDDEYFELFIRSNNLSGVDILILPAGREVVVYG